MRAATQMGFVPQGSAGSQWVRYAWSCGTIQPSVLSTVVDCSGNDVAVLRKGKITVGNIVDVLGYMPRVLT